MTIMLVKLLYLSFGVVLGFILSSILVMTKDNHE